MKRRLVTIILLVLAALTAASSKAAEQVHPPVELRFNPEALETLRGMVIDAPIIHRDGVPEMIHLTLKTERESILVILAPNWYLAELGVKIYALDPLEVTGARVSLNGKTAIIAQKIRKGEQVYEFRELTGRPRWAPFRPQTR